MASGIARASALMASGTMVSRLLGFVKTALLAFAIGQTQSISADAFANGSMLPNTLYVMLVGGMLSSVLVPLIVKASMGPDGGAAYINKIMTLILSILTVVTAAAMVAAPWLVHLFTLDWESSQRALATAFAYWCLPQILLYGLFTVLGEVLNARSFFGPFSWAPAINNLVGILGIVAFIMLFGPDPNGDRVVADWNPVSIGVLAGSGTLGVALQAMILYVAWRKVGIRYRPDFRWRHMGLSQTARVAAWSLGSVVVMQLGTIITTNVANSASGAGPSASAMQNAWLLFVLPHSVLAMAVGTAYFTRLAESGQSGDAQGYRHNFQAATRIISVIMLFMTALLMAIAPYVSRVMQFGANQEMVDLFAVVLRAYLIGLAAFSFLFVVQRGFYALADTRTPFFFNVIQIVLYSGLGFVALLLPKTLTVVGLVLGWTIATLLETLIAVLLLRRKVGRLNGRRILRTLTSAIPAAVIAALLGFWIVEWLADAFGPASVWGALLRSAGVGLLLLLVYVAALWATRSPDLAEVTQQVRARLTPRGRHE